MGDVIGLGRQRPDGRKVVELRKGLGLKQEGLAEKAGLSVRLLRDVERENRPIKDATLTALATQLNATPEDIILEDRSSSPLSGGRATSTVFD